MFGSNYAEQTQICVNKTLWSSVSKTYTSPHMSDTVGFDDSWILFLHLSAIMYFMASKQNHLTEAG